MKRALGVEIDALVCALDNNVLEAVSVQLLNAKQAVKTEKQAHFQVLRVCLNTCGL